MSLGETIERRHSVDFYDDAAAHLDLVGGRLGQALAAGGTAFLVATPDHRASLIGALAERFDVARLRHQGRLVEYDAHEIARQLVGGDRADPLGSLPVKAIRGARAPVVVYGEVVAVLWDLGFFDQATALEDVWNEVLDQADFSLLCGYRAGGFGPAQKAFFHRLCARHSELIGADVAAGKDPVVEVRASWPADVTTPRSARQFVSSALEGFVDEERQREAMLIVTELVTNSVAHASSPVGVTLCVGADGVIKVVVTDELSTGIDEHRAVADTLATRGRGLTIVEALSSRWGAERLPVGKAVWAEMGAGRPAG